MPRAVCAATRLFLWGVRTVIDWRDLRIEFDENGVPKTGEIVFSHVDDKTDEVRHFAVERIEKWLRTRTDIPIIRTRIDPIFAMFAVKYRGVEQHRFARITKRQIKTNPIVLAHMPGIGRDTTGEHLMIDGTHRYCKAAMLGMEHIHAYELQPEHWEPFLIDIPEMDSFTREQMIGQANGVPIDSRIA